MTAAVEHRRNAHDQLEVNNYVLLHKLGSGSYGHVHLSEDKRTRKMVAIKIVNKSKLRKKRLGISDEELLREVEVMKALRHRNVVSLLEVIDDIEHDRMFMVRGSAHRQQSEVITGFGGYALGLGRFKSS